jgi:hypothetical protein
MNELSPDDRFLLTVVCCALILVLAIITGSLLMKMHDNKTRIELVKAGAPAITLPCLLPR